MNLSSFNSEESASQSQGNLRQNLRQAVKPDFGWAVRWTRVQNKKCLDSGTAPEAISCLQSSPETIQQPASKFSATYNYVGTRDDCLPSRCTRTRRAAMALGIDRLLHEPPNAAAFMEQPVSTPREAPSSTSPTLEKAKIR